MGIIKHFSLKKLEHFSGEIKAQCTKAYEEQKPANITER